MLREIETLYEHKELLATVIRIEWLRQTEPVKYTGDQELWI